MNNARGRHSMVIKECPRCDSVLAVGVNADLSYQSNGETHALGDLGICQNKHSFFFFFFFFLNIKDPETVTN